MTDKPIVRKKKVPPGGYKRIRELTANGAREVDIARELKMSVRVWQDLKKEDLFFQSFV